MAIKWKPLLKLHNSLNLQLHIVIIHHHGKKYIKNIHENISLHYRYFIKLHVFFTQSFYLAIKWKPLLKLQNLLNLQLHYLINVKKYVELIL